MAQYQRLDEVFWKELTPEEYFDICFREVKRGADPRQIIPCQYLPSEHSPEWTALRTAWVRNGSLYKILAIEIKRYPQNIGTCAHYIDREWITLDEYYDLCIDVITIDVGTLSTICGCLSRYKILSKTKSKKHLVKTLFTSEQWYRLALLAIEQDPSAGLFIEQVLGKNFWNKNQELWNKICHAMVNRNGIIIGAIKQSLALQHVAVDNTPLAISYIAHPSEELIVKAVSQCGLLIATERIQRQSKKICLAAYVQTRRIYGHIMAINRRRYVLCVDLAPKLACLQISPLLRVEIAAAYECCLIKESLARPRIKMDFHHLWDLAAAIDCVASHE